MMSLKVTQKATARNARTDWKEGNNQQLTGAQRNNKNNTGEIPEKVHTAALHICAAVNGRAFNLTCLLLQTLIN